MKLKTLLCLSVVACSLCFVGGCGGNEPTVITPGDDYQLDEREQANLEKEAQMRKEGR